MKTVATAALVLSMFVPAALAETNSARMAVSVTVIGRAIVAFEAQPDVVITEADVRRGYVDVVEPVQMRVRSNSLRGYLLQVAKTNEAFTAVELSFGNSNMTIAQESWISRPHVAGSDVVTARMRVRLAPGAVAGRHPLPIEVSARPL